MIGQIVICGRWSGGTLDMIFIILLAVSAILDIRTRTIPNWIPAALIVLAIIQMIQNGSAINIFGILPSVVVGIILYQGGKGIGGGDIKVMAGIGLYTGLISCVQVVTLGCLGAIIWCCFLRMLRHQKQKRGIPFCFWIFAGTLTVFVIR